MIRRYLLLALFMGLAFGAGRGFGATTFVSPVQTLTCAASNWVHSLANTGIFGCTQPASTDLSDSSSVARLATADQTLSGGANVTATNLGTKSSGTTTIDCGTVPLQYLTDGGAFTLAAPSNDGSCDVLVINNASAGAITFSGFSVGSNTGDTLDTTNAHKFTLSIWRINGTSGYRVAAHQ